MTRHAAVLHLPGSVLALRWDIPHARGAIGLIAIRRNGDCEVTHYTSDEGLCAAWAHLAGMVDGCGDDFGGMAVERMSDCPAAPESGLSSNQNRS